MGSIWEQETLSLQTPGMLESQDPGQGWTWAQRAPLGRGPGWLPECEAGWVESSTSSRVSVGLPWGWATFPAILLTLVPRPLSP